MSANRFQEEVIRRWFNDNRPDLEVDFFLIQFIIEKVEENYKISELTSNAQRAIITEYLSINYDTTITDIIKRIITETNEEDKEFAEIINDWNNMGIYDSEIGTIYRNIIAKEIPENHQTFEDSMGYDSSIIEVIKDEIINYVKNW